MTLAERRAEALDRVRRGVALTVAAELAGVTFKTLREWMRDAGVTKPKPRPRIEPERGWVRHSPEARARAVAAYVAGKSSDEAAGPLGVGRGTLLGWVRDAGHAVRPPTKESRKKWSPWEAPRIIKLRTKLRDERKAAADRPKPERARRPKPERPAKQARPPKVREPKPARERVVKPPKAPRPPRYQPEPLKVIALYLRGMSTREVGATVGRSFTWVQKVLRRESVELRPRVPDLGPGTRAAAVAELRAALDRDETVQSVAQRFGIGLSTLSNWANKDGVPKRHKALPLLNREAAVAEAYAAGVPVAEICERNGCSQSHVTNVAKRHGLPLRHPSQRRVLTVDEVARARAMIAGGSKLREVATALHVKQDTLRAALRSDGSVMRKGPRVTVERIEQCVQLYVEGKSIRAIGLELRIDKRLVTRALEERGVPIRPRSESVWLARGRGTPTAATLPTSTASSATA